MSLDWSSPNKQSRPPQPRLEPPSKKVLYKNKETGWLTGVCAGIADYFGMSAGMVRILTIFISFFLPVIWLAYIIMAFLLPIKPLPVHRTGVHLHQELNQLQDQLQQAEHKLRSMENYVTSDEFAFQRKINELKQQL